MPLLSIAYRYPVFAIWSSLHQWYSEGKKKLAWKSFALSGLFGALVFFTQKKFFVKTIKSYEFKSEKRNIFFVSLKNEVKLLPNSKNGPFR